MNREDLDAWFAQADDVLTDWHGSADAMHASRPVAVSGLHPARDLTQYRRMWQELYPGVLRPLPASSFTVGEQGPEMYVWRDGRPVPVNP